MPRTSAADRKRQEAEAPKLTRPQSEALVELMVKDQTWSDGWPPPKRLVELGLATVRHGKWGGAKFTITDLGRIHPAVASRG